MHSVESRCVIGPENILFVGASVHLSARYNAHICRVVLVSLNAIRKYVYPILARFPPPPLSLSLSPCICKCTRHQNTVLVLLSFGNKADALLLFQNQNTND